MVETSFSRKLDTSGRIMIPVRLREQMNLVSGEEYYFFTHEENGRRFICLECPRTPETKLQEAMKLLEENGMKIVPSED